jgi:hypothetical protein
MQVWRQGQIRLGATVALWHGCIPLGVPFYS